MLSYGLRITTTAGQPPQSELSDMFDDLRDDQRARLEETHKAALASIMELVGPLMTDEASDDDREAAEQAIYEDALSAEMRSGWITYGGEFEPAEYRICITTGGPAVQIKGKLNQWGEAESARLEVQDWFTPWVEFPVTNDQADHIAAYAQRFYFGS